jgi:hypothetical protein
VFGEGNQQSKRFPTVSSPANNWFSWPLIRVESQFCTALGADHGSYCVSRSRYKHYKWLAEMAHHTQFKVVHCITEMFTETPALLHNPELVILIDTFWQRAVEKRYGRFLGFLRSICVDDFNRPLDSNQEDVLNAVVRNLPDDLFQEKPREMAVVVRESAVQRGGREAQGYSFSLELVQLAAALCDGRMQGALKLFLRDAPMFGFTYNNILSKISDETATIAGYAPSSSYDVRRVYIKAMWAMYVDRQSSAMERQTQQRTRIWEGMDKSQLISIAPPVQDVEQPATPGFVDLKDALRSILVSCAGGIDASCTSKNLMVLEALSLMQFIIRQGYYDPRPLDSIDDGVLLLGDELKELLKYLVRLMDGRDDVGYVDSRRLQELDLWQRDELSKPGSSARFEVNQENRVVFRIKTKSLQILNDLLDLKSSTRVDRCMKALVKAQEDSSRGMFSRATSTQKLTNEPVDSAETVNPLADARTFEVESPTSGSDTIELAEAAAPLPDDQESEGEDDDLDSDFDRKTRQIALAAVKADQDNTDEFSLFLDKEDESKFEEILLDNLRYVPAPYHVYVTFVCRICM